MSRNEAKPGAPTRAAEQRVHLPPPAVGPVALHGDSVWAVLNFIKDNISTVRLVDPANTNNVIDVPQGTRAALKIAAARCLGASNWSQIIW